MATNKFLFFFPVEQTWRQTCFVFISSTVLFAYFQICKKYQLHCQCAQKASHSAFVYYARYILEVNSLYGWHFIPSAEVQDTETQAITSVTE